MDPVLADQLKKMNPDTAAIVMAILSASKIDEQKRIDDLISDVGARRMRLFDVIYVDLAIDRSANPLEITGAGTFIHAVEATDDLANLNIGFEPDESDTNKRIQIKDGKRLYLPFTKFFIYHTAQSGKYMKLLRGREVPSLRMGVEDDSGESANSDLVTALGNSSTFSTGQATVDTTVGGTTIIAANTSRKRVTITNAGSNTVYIRTTAPTTANAHALLAGNSITLNSTAAVKGITSAGSSVVTYLEE